MKFKFYIQLLMAPSQGDMYIFKVHQAHVTLRTQTFSGPGFMVCLPTEVPETKTKWN